MKHKALHELTTAEIKLFDTIAVNYIIAQSDGFQLGYAQALADMTENLIDYWRSSDDEPQQSILDLLIDLGVELGKRKDVVEKNKDAAKEKGYENYYWWRYKKDADCLGTNVGLYTMKEDK